MISIFALLRPGTVAITGLPNRTTIITTALMTIGFARVVATTRMSAACRMAMIISTPVIRMTPVAIMVYPQQVVRPTKSVNRRYAPKIARRENIVRWIRIVINRVRPRIIVIHGCRLIDDDAARLVIRNVNDFRIDGSDFDNVVNDTDCLPVIAFEVTCQHSAAAKSLDRVEDVDLLTIRLRGTYARTLLFLEKSERELFEYANYGGALVLLAGLALITAGR